MTAATNCSAARAEGVLRLETFGVRPCSAIEYPEAQSPRGPGAVCGSTPVADSETLFDPADGVPYLKVWFRLRYASPFIPGTALLGNACGGVTSCTCAAMLSCATVISRRCSRGAVDGLGQARAYAATRTTLTHTPCALHHAPGTIMHHAPCTMHKKKGKSSAGDARDGLALSGARWLPGSRC